MDNKIINLNLLNDFQCIGDKCPASCCSDVWRIRVDDDTINKWKSIESEEARNKLINSYELDKEKNEFLLKKTSSGGCVNLAHNGFCSIHNEYGHDFIPEICRDYPRRNHDIKFLSVSSLALSCPEVTRMLFENNNNKSLFDLKISDKNNSELSALQIDPALAEILHNFVQECINSEKYPPSVILLHIGQVLCDMSKLSALGELDVGSLKRLTSKTNQLMFNVNKYLKTHSQDADKVATSRLWRFILYLIPGAYTFIPVDADMHQKISSMFSTMPKDGAELSLFYDSLSGMRDNYRQTITNDQRKMMKNYLKVKFINHAFPWDPMHGNIIALFLNCVLPYMLIQILLWITKDAKGMVGTSDIISVVYRVERRLDHNIKIYEYLSDNPELLHLDKYLNFLKDA